MRCCSTCQVDKELDDFPQFTSRTGQRKHRRVCRDCIRNRKGPNTPDRLVQMRKSNFLRKYGLSWEQYQQMFIDRDGKCDICSLPETRRVKGKLMPLCVDHEDTTAGVRIRGLLCSNCNVAIGLLKHDPILVKSAYRYLRRT